MHESLARQLYLHGDLTHEPEYFGRGMSKPTHAVFGSQEALNTALVGLFNDVVQDAFDAGALSVSDPAAEDRFRGSYAELKLESLASLRVDSIGNELIFY